MLSAVAYPPIYVSLEPYIVCAFWLHLGPRIRSLKSQLGKLPDKSLKLSSGLLHADSLPQQMSSLEPGADEQHADQVEAVAHASSEERPLPRTRKCEHRDSRKELIDTNSANYSMEERLDSVMLWLC